MTAPDFSDLVAQEAATDALACVFNSERSIVWMNVAFRFVLGFGPSEDLSQTDSVSYFPFAEGEPDDPLSKAARVGTWHGALVVSGRGGIQVNLNASILRKAIVIDGPTVFVLVATKTD